MNKHLIVLGIVIVLLAVGLSGCLGNELVGTWERDTGKRLTFFDDGTAHWNNQDYCYKVEDGIITMCLGCDWDWEPYIKYYEYRVDGNTLIFGGIQYTKV